MLKNDAMARIESQKFLTVLSSIGTIILKVCEGPESVTEKWNGLGRLCVCVGIRKPCPRLRNLEISFFLIFPPKPIIF